MPRVEEELLVLLARPRLSEADRSRCAVLAQAEGFDWGFVLDHASRNRIVPMLGRHLVADGLWQEWTGRPNPHRRLLGRAYEANLVRNAALARELRVVLAALEARGVQPVVRKGLMLATHVYGDPGARESNDLDLFVDRTQVGAVQEALAELGYAQGTVAPGGRQIVPPDRRAHIYWARHGNTLYPFQRLTSEPFVGSFNVDVCVDLFLPDSGFSAPWSVMADDVVTTILPGGPARAFAPAAFLFDLCAHLFKEARTLVFISWGSDLQLVKFADIVELVAVLGAAFPWNRFDQLVEATGTSRPMAFALHSCEQLYPGSLPSEVLARYPADGAFLRQYGDADGEVGQWDGDIQSRLFDTSRSARVPASRSPIVGSHPQSS